MFGNRGKRENISALKRTIRESDRGKKQAKEQLKAMSESQDSEMLSQIAEARVELYSRAAYEGDKKAQYQVGLSQAALGNKEVSLEWLTGLAKQGDVRAMKAIAQGYAPDGIYGYRREEYRHWLQKAAEAGDARSQAKLGDFYVGKNEKLSREWYRKAAVQKLPEGCLGFGRSCYNEALLYAGEKEKQEELREEAEKYFLRAANYADNDRDFSGACHELGVLYESMLAGGQEELAQRAAFFYYQAWTGAKAAEDLTAFQRIRDRYQLNVNPADLKKWEEQVFGKRKDSHGEEKTSETQKK